MPVQIERQGLDTAVRGVLGCVVAPLFAEVMQAYRALDAAPLVDYSALLKLAERTGDKTPFHMLLEFASYGQDDPSAFTITHNAVIRLFCTKYHFDFVAKNLLDPMRVQDTSSFLVNHMLLPMRLSKQDGQLQGEYRLDGHTMRVAPLIAPPDLELVGDTIYGVHMGSILTALTEAQIRMIDAQLALSTEFGFIARHVTAVDFSNYQYFGDFHQRIAERHAQVFNA